MGLGRSGSTLLDVFLGNHPGMRSIGQFADFVRTAWIHSTTCSCGQLVTDCPFWSEVRERWHRYLDDHSEQEYEHLREFHERMSRGPFSIPASRLSTKDFKLYIASTAALYRSAFEACEGKILVDSSKMPLRAFHLSRIPEFDLRIIHMLRDGRAVAYSWNKPARRNARDVSRTAIDWMATNLASEWVLRNTDAPSLRLRYEDFVDDPVKALRSIGALVDEDMDTVISRLTEDAPMHVTHVASGNQLRFQGQIRLKPDREWRTSMSDRDQRRVWMITKPLMLRYGYSRDNDYREE